MQQFLLFKSNLKLNILDTKKISHMKVADYIYVLRIKFVNNHISFALHPKQIHKHIKKKILI